MRGGGVLCCCAGPQLPLDQSQARVLSVDSVGSVGSVGMGSVRGDEESVPLVAAW